MLDLPSLALLSISYVGIFALSLGANLIVFVPLPYLAVVLAAALSGHFDPVLLIVSSAVGSALGKMIVFQACYSGQRIIKGKTRGNLEAFRRLFSSYAWIAILIAASTPIPDDMVYVPLGFARYNRIKFFISTLVGKTLLVSVLVYGAALLTNSILGSFLAGSESGIGQLIIIGATFALLTIGLTFLITRINWDDWIEKRINKKHNTNERSVQ